MEILKIIALVLYFLLILSAFIIMISFTVTFLKDETRKKRDEIKDATSIGNAVRNLQSELLKLENEIDKETQQLKYFPIESDIRNGIELNIQLNKEKYEKVYEDLEGWKKKLCNKTNFII